MKNEKGMKHLEKEIGSYGHEGGHGHGNSELKKIEDHHMHKKRPF